MNVRHSNRKTQQDKKVKKLNRNERTKQGEEAIRQERMADCEDYNLGWFKPSENQKEIIYSMCINDLTAVQGSSGCGKSTTAIFQALSDMRRGSYKKLVFVKTPVESGDDMIGFLSGDANQKLEAHFMSMRSIFHTFMSKAKLAMEEKRERIEFTIPNFIAGKTIDNAIIIIDESQTLSPTTLKLILERAGEDSRIVLLGDKYQCYAARKRKDGLSHFISMITEEDEDGVLVSKEPTMGYVELTADDNMRSALSRRVVELYESQE